MKLVRLALVVAVLLGTTSACDSASTPDATPEPTPGHRTITLLPETVPPGIGISFSQQRTDEGSRRARVRVANGTGRTLRVQAVGVEWDAFPAQPQPERYPVPAQTVIDLPYRLPRADCSPAAADSPMRGVVVTEDRIFHRDMPDDGRRFLERLWRSECAARAIDAVVDLAWDVSGDPAEVESGEWLDVRRIALVVRRKGRSDSTVDVSQAQGSVLFELDVPATSIDSGEPTVRVPVDVSPGRCDEHGRSQATQPFTWRVWLSIDGGELQAVIVAPRQGEQQEGLLAWLDRACGGYTGH